MDDWLLAAKNEALQLPGWDKIQDLLRRKIYENLRRHDVSHFSDLSDVERAVYVDEAHESLRNDPEFHAFQYELSVAVDYHLVHEMDDALSGIDERAKLNILLSKASQGALAILQRLPEQSSSKFLRGLINRTMHPTLRAAVWRAFLRHKQVQKWTASSNGPNKSHEMANDVSERLKSMYAKYFPDATEKNLLAAISVCCMMGSYQSTNNVSDIVLHLSAAVCHVFQDLEETTHLVEAVACLHDAVSSLKLDGNLARVQRVVSERLRHVDISRLLQPFWDGAWVGYFSLETLLFCLDQVVLSGRDGTQLVYVLLSTALLNHCADKLIAFHGDEDALHQYFNRCAGSITPESLSSAFLPYEKELFTHLNLIPLQVPIVKVRPVLPTASPQPVSYHETGPQSESPHGLSQRADDNGSVRTEERNWSMMSPFQAASEDLRYSPISPDLRYTPITPDLHDAANVALGDGKKKTDPFRSRLHLLGAQVEMDVLDALSRLPKEDFDPHKPRPQVKLGKRSRALPPIQSQDTVCEICTHANLNAEDVAEQLIAMGLVDDRESPTYKEIHSRRPLAWRKYQYVLDTSKLPSR
eukprot:GEMP01012454.1.p1 GENE.GEMP01012454.1~~GEMP01012454.1.p1  ORF type:complete len:584 (+),score=126.90 GEMP01012454.1:61-1812(+)